MKDPEQLHIELQVLGDCMEGNYLHVADIINADHFSNEFHKKVFYIISQIFDKEPLTYTNVSRHYQIKFKDIDYFKIPSIQINHVRSCPQFHALLLLEFNIRSKVSELFASYEHAAVMAKDIKQADEWKEIKIHLLEAPDILKAMDKIWLFMQQQKPDELDDYKILYDSIPKVANRIRQKTKLRMIVNQLMELHSGSGKRSSLVKSLTDILIISLTAAKLPDGFENDVYRLSTKLL